MTQCECVFNGKCTVDDQQRCNPDFIHTGMRDEVAVVPLKLIRANDINFRYVRKDG